MRKIVTAFGDQRSDYRGLPKGGSAAVTSTDWGSQDNAIVRRGNSSQQNSESSSQPTTSSSEIKQKLDTIMQNNRHREVMSAVQNLSSDLRENEKVIQSLVKTVKDLSNQVEKLQSSIQNSQPLPAPNTSIHMTHDDETQGFLELIEEESIPQYLHRRGNPVTFHPDSEDENDNDSDSIDGFFSRIVDMGTGASRPMPDAKLGPPLIASSLSASAALTMSITACKGTDSDSPASSREHRAPIQSQSNQSTHADSSAWTSNEDSFESIGHPQHLWKKPRIRTKATWR